MKFFVTLLLTCLIAILAGMVPLNPAFRALARELMHERMLSQHAYDESQITLVAEADISDWEEEGKEFRLNGRLYDVAGTCTIDGRSYYRCLTDEVELAAEQTAARAQHTAARPNPNTAHDRLVKAIADWLAGLFVETPEPLRLCCRFSEKNGCGVMPGSFWKGPFLAIGQHPPELI